MTFTVGTGAKAVLRSLVGILTAAVMFLLWRMGAVEWSIVPMAVAVAVWAVYLPRLVASVQGVIDRRRLQVRYGVFWKREITVPYDAIRTVEWFTPPIHALFSCRTLVLRFAGGSVWVPLLDNVTARRMTAYLEAV